MALPYTNKHLECNYRSRFMHAGLYLFQVLLQSCLSICDLLDSFVEGVVDYLPLFQYVLLGLAEYTVNDTTQGGGSDSLLLCLTYVDI